MKKFIILFSSCLLSFNCVAQQHKEQSLLLKTLVQERPAGQTDVLELRTESLPVVRVAFIGLGMRGPGAVNRMTYIPGVEVVALCDVEQKNTEKVNKMEIVIIGRIVECLAYLFANVQFYLS